MLIRKMFKGFFLLPVWQRISRVVLLSAIFTFCLLLNSAISRTGKGIYYLSKPLPCLKAGQGPSGQIGAAEPRIILLILDKITLPDLLSYAGPELTLILDKSAVSLMNVNTATTPGTESGYLTIGAGIRLAGNWTARRAFNRDEDLLRGETVEVLYRRHTGKVEAPPGEVLHLYSGALARLNEKRPYPVYIGALGEALNTENLGVAVLGNADTDTPNRQIVTIAMNSEGVVQYGDVSSALLQERESFPFGCGSDPEAYYRVFESLLPKASLLVVEWGDTCRLDSYLEHLPAGRRSVLLQASLGELDLFLQGIKPYLQGNTSLLLVSPSPPQAAFAGEQRLMPVVYFHPGMDGGGLLVSPTTRRPGIITNLDIAPFILHYLGVKTPAFFFGAPLQAIPAANHLQRLLSLAEDTARVYNQRPAVIKGYILAQIIILLGGLAGLIYRFKPTKFLRPGLYALLFFPLALLLAPALPFYPAESFYINIFALTGLTALLTLFARLLFRKLLPLFAFTGLFVFAVLTVDLCRGACLNSRSFLGYDPIGGARFYGLGNEYMGIMIGALILGFGSLCSLLSRQEDLSWWGYKNTERTGLVFVVWSFVILSFFVLFLLASPLYGANFGGAVTAGIALSVTLSGMLALLRQKGYDLLPFSPVGGIKYLFSGRRIFSRGGDGGRGEGEGTSGSTVFPNRRREKDAGSMVSLKHGKKVSTGGTVFPSHGREKAAGSAPVPFYCSHKIILMAAFMLVTAASLYFLNTSSHPDAAVSHVGRTWELVCSHGPTELVNIARRKMEMNLKLLRFSLWSRVLFAFIFLISLLYFYPVGLTQQIFKEEPGFKLALGGIIAGSFTALLVNDSGVVAAATTMLYGALPLLLLCFQKVFP